MSRRQFQREYWNHSLIISIYIRHVTIFSFCFTRLIYSMLIAPHKPHISITTHFKTIPLCHKCTFKLSVKTFKPKKCLVAMWSLVFFRALLEKNTGTFLIRLVMITRETWCVHKNPAVYIDKLFRLGMSIKQYDSPTMIQEEKRRCEVSSKKTSTLW